MSNIQEMLEERSVGSIMESPSPIKTFQFSSTGGVGDDGKKKENDPQRQFNDKFTETVKKLK